MSRPGILRGVDRAAFAVALVHRLRAAGVPVGLSSLERFTLALGTEPLDSRARLYWAARITLVHTPAELTVFDEVFAAVFDDATLEVDPHARRTPRGAPAGDDERMVPSAGRGRQEQEGTGLPWVTLPPAVGTAEDSDSPLALPLRLPSLVPGLADVPFAELSPRELALLGAWLESQVRSWPTRRSRRMTTAPDGGRVAFRATVAQSRRTGWEPIELVRSEPLRKLRRVVMLCDVSQSMQAEATAYLHLMRALAVTVDAEVFAFATRLTRLTAALSHRSAEVAIAQATDKVVDRFGGTRIAANLGELLASHHGGLLRGAVVIIASDGWDSDPPEQLATVMARLHRRAHRVVWMNPRVSAPGFEPTVATMAAALPYCDRLLPADTFRSLVDLLAEVTRSARGPRSSGRPPVRPAISSTA